MQLDSADKDQLTLKSICDALRRQRPGVMSSERITHNCDGEIGLLYGVTLHYVLSYVLSVISRVC